jgi:hypothetical protein
MAKPLSQLNPQNFGLDNTIFVGFLIKFKENRIRTGGSRPWAR